MSVSDSGVVAVGTTCALLIACTSIDTDKDTLPIVAAGQLARQIESYTGKGVRACGSLEKIEGNDLWKLNAPADPHPHGAAVYIVPCNGNKPISDRNGCIAGRIALRDGSLDVDQLRGPITMSDAIASHIWYLHAQCPARL